MYTNESHVSHDGAHVLICVLVHMFGCAFVYWFLFHVRKLSQGMGKHIEGRCVNSSCSALPSSKESLCHRVSTLFFFLQQRETFHTTEKCDFNFKGILTVTNIDDERDSNLLLDSHINFVKTLMLFCEKRTGWCWTECIALNEEVEDYHSHAVGLQQTE